MNKFCRVMITGLTFCIVFITGCSKSVSTESNNEISKPTTEIPELKFEDIQLQSARIELAHTGGNASKIYTFDFNNSDHAKILTNVIKCLNSSKIQGNSDEEVNIKGGSPTCLILELKDGSIIQIKAAVGFKVTKFPDGSSKTEQFNIPNEVTISKNINEETYIIQSPEIRELIDNGYKNLSNIPTESSKIDNSDQITIDPNSN